MLIRCKECLFWQQSGGWRSKLPEVSFIKVASIDVNQWWEFFDFNAQCSSKTMGWCTLRLDSKWFESNNFLWRVSIQPGVRQRACILEWRKRDQSKKTKSRKVNWWSGLELIWWTYEFTDYNLRDGNLTIERYAGEINRSRGSILPWYLSDCYSFF